MKKFAVLTAVVFLFGVAGLVVYVFVAGVIRGVG